MHLDCDCRAGLDGALLAYAAAAAGVAPDVVAAHACDGCVGLGHADALGAVLRVLDLTIARGFRDGETYHVDTVHPEVLEDGMAQGFLGSKRGEDE